MFIHSPEEYIFTTTLVQATGTYATRTKSGQKRAQSMERKVKKKKKKLQKAVKENYTHYGGATNVVR